MSTLSDGALHALQGAVADGRAVHLAVIRDRRVYAEVDRALAGLGGRWNHRERAYLFPRDPRPQLERLTGSRMLPPPCAGTDKALSFWPTPPALAAELVDGLDLEDGAKVLEPSAGDGALVAALRAAYPTARVAAVEVDEQRASRILGPGRTHPEGSAAVYVTSFEDYAAQQPSPFDAVVMNPPFTLPGNRYAWATHLALAWSLLRPGGQLRAIVPASIEYGRQRPIAAARQLVLDAGGSWRAAPEGAFRSAGTMVRTCVVEATRE